MIKIRNKSENGYPPTPCKPQVQIGDKTITNNKKQTTMNKQKHYVPPRVAIYRVEVESVIAVAVSAGKINANYDPSWGADNIWGDLSSEGGDVYLTW
jgi:hypothetical protein